MNQEYKVPFLSGIARTKLIHGIEITEPEYVELAFLAWDKINTKPLQPYRFCEKVEGNSIKLPCNVEVLEAVTVESYTGYPIDSIYPEGFYIENSFRAYETPFSSSLYEIRGNFIRYQVRDSTLYFYEDDLARVNGREVTVYYQGVITDDDGYPYLTERQAEAISYYIAYVMNHRKLMQGMGDANLVAYLKNEWLAKCSQARVPIQFTQNAFDNILDAQSSWNRKRWNRGYSV